MKKLFSLIALAGVIAACTPEQIETAFKLAGAKGTIEVEVVKLDGTPYEGQFQITGYDALPGNSISYAGNKATISFQAAESAAVTLADLTLTATGENILYPETGKVTVPSLLAGQEAKLSCRIRVGENADGWYVDIDEKTISTFVEDGFLANDAYPTYAYSHGGIESWYVNNTENYLTGSVTVVDKYGFTEGYNFEFNNYVGFENSIANFKAIFEPEDMETEEIKYDFKVSAWAMWNVVVEYLGYLREGALTATKIGEDGKLTKEVIDLAKCNYKFYLGSLYGAIEIPYPEATGHYVEGHGHAHGGDNAGGGISFNE